MVTKRFRPAWLYPITLTVCGGEVVTARGLTYQARAKRLSKKAMAARVRAGYIPR
jgi:hypothetical protein